MPVIASILLTPDEIENSEIIFNIPISPVLDTWVPPQNSLENSFISMILTVSPYFSSKSASASRFFASSKLFI